MGLTGLRSVHLTNKGIIKTLIHNQTEQKKISMNFMTKMEISKNCFGKHRIFHNFFSSSRSHLTKNEPLINVNWHNKLEWFAQVLSKSSLLEFADDIKQKPNYVTRWKSLKNFDDENSTELIWRTRSTQDWARSRRTRRVWTSNKWKKKETRKIMVCPIAAITVDTPAERRKQTSLLRDVERPRRCWPNAHWFQTIDSSSLAFSFFLSSDVSLSFQETTVC